MLANYTGRNLAMLVGKLAVLAVALVCLKPEIGLRKNLEPKIDSRFVQFQLAEAGLLRLLAPNPSLRSGAREVG